MSASHEWTEWHLTRRGWEQGSSLIDFGAVQKKPPPDDRVATYTHDQYMGSIYSQLQKSTRRTWICDDQELVKRLTHKFGNCPDHL